MATSMMAQDLALAKTDPESARKLIVDRGMAPFAAGIVKALRSSSSKTGACYACHRPHREIWAFRLFAKIAKLVDMSPQVSIAVFNELGVDIGAAKRSIRIVREVEAMTEEERESEAVEFLKERGWRCER